MKRIGNIYQKMYSTENLLLAEKNARKGKSGQYGVFAFDKNPEANILHLQDMLQSRTYNTSRYTLKTVYEPKERLVYCLPYFPDRVAHHAAMLQLEDMFVSTFTTDTYSCIKNRGIHALVNNLKYSLQNKEQTKYALQIDLRKFYPNVKHDILKNQLQRKIKDPKMLWFLYNVIDSAPGVPIGNYLSSYFSNFYLTPFDHWIKEDQQAGPYFRYSDDILTLADNKPQLHKLLYEIRSYLGDTLKLEVKGNYQIYPVASRGIDIVGYVLNHDYIRLRKRIKQNWARAVAKNKPLASLNSYRGLAKHGDCKHLIKKLSYYGNN